MAELKTGTRPLKQEFPLRDLMKQATHLSSSLSSRTLYARLDIPTFQICKKDYMIQVEIVVKEGFEIAIVHLLCTELTSATADKFRKKLALLMGKNVQYFIINLEQIEFIDSAGLGAIISITKRVRELRGDIKLASIQPAPKKLFKTIHADRYFPTHESVSDALNCLFFVSKLVPVIAEKQKKNKSAHRFRWF